MSQNKFIEVPASNQSIAQRKLVYGHGVNDATYLTQTNNKICPFYRRWRSMITRCYSNRYHETRPTYIGCSVCKAWLKFSTFRLWMELQDWENKDLDKDIITPNNKIYNPDNCCFISKQLNTLLTNSAAIRGEYPLGVSWHKRLDKFSSCCSNNGKLKHLGYYFTQEDASKAYRQFKHRLIMEASVYQTDSRIKKGLIRHADLLIIEE